MDETKAGSLWRCWYRSCLGEGMQVVDFGLGGGPIFGRGCSWRSFAFCGLGLVEKEWGDRRSDWMKAIQCIAREKSPLGSIECAKSGINY